MGYLFVEEGLVDLSITARDSTLLKQRVVYGTIDHGKRNNTSVLALIQMQDGAIVIPNYGFSITALLHN